MVEEVQDMKIGAGQYHSCFIANAKDQSADLSLKKKNEKNNEPDQLFVWGL